VDSLLHPDYHGISLQGPRDKRHIYVETREKAVSDVASLKPGDWDARFLSTSTQIDPNGMAHVWARYVFYFKGAPNHWATSPTRCTKAPTVLLSPALTPGTPDLSVSGGIHLRR
jgi:hypothetical protein